MKYYIFLSGVSKGLGFAAKLNCLFSSLILSLFWEQRRKYCCPFYELQNILYSFGTEENGFAPVTT